MIVGCCMCPYYTYIYVCVHTCIRPFFLLIRYGDVYSVTDHLTHLHRDTERAAVRFAIS